MTWPTDCRDLSWLSVFVIYFLLSRSSRRSKNYHFHWLLLRKLSSSFSCFPLMFAYSWINFSLSVILLWNNDFVFKMFLNFYLCFYIIDRFLTRYLKLTSFDMIKFEVFKKSIWIEEKFMDYNFDFNGYFLGSRT